MTDQTYKFIQQAGVLLFGCSAVLLLGVPDSWTKWKRWKRWAPIFGLCSQPFWFWIVWESGWGAKYVNVFYTLSWFSGFWLNWITPLLAKRTSRGVALKNGNP